MGIKFEGEPPFDLGVVQTASAQVLDATVVVKSDRCCPDDTTKTRPSSAHDDGGTCKAISRAIGNCCDNGRASQAQQPSFLATCHEARRLKPQR